MNADNLVILCHIEVALNGIRVLFPRQAKRGQRIFRGIVRGTSMSYDILRTTRCGSAERHEQSGRQIAVSQEFLRSWPEVGIFVRCAMYAPPVSISVHNDAVEPDSVGVAGH